MRKATRRIAALVLVISLAGAVGCARSGKGDIDARVANLERRLTTTCSCHPRRIEGLPIEAAIRADLRRWILEGRDDDTILWMAFQRYGKELLTAGIRNLQGEVLFAAGTVVFILAASLAALVANLRGTPRERAARRASGPAG